MNAKAVDWIILGSAILAYGVFSLAVERGDLASFRARMTARMAALDAPEWVAGLQASEAMTAETDAESNAETDA